MPLTASPLKWRAGAESTRPWWSRGVAWACSERSFSRISIFWSVARTNASCRAIRTIRFTRPSDLFTDGEVMGLLLAALFLATDTTSWEKQEEAHLKNIRQATKDFVRAGEGYFSPDGKQIIFQAEER